MEPFCTLRVRTHGAPRATRGASFAAVAIPVRNEAQRITRCLDALAAAAQAHGTRAHIILALNGCTDDSWEVANRHAERYPLPITVADMALVPSANHAGGARAAALRLALESGGDRPAARIFTTDADTQVAPDWFIRAHRALDAGNDAVAGMTHVASPRHWPVHVRQRQAIERRLHRLLDEIDALCDPITHNPWPTHRQASGANLAFRASALRCLPTLPMPSCGEDRALIQACHAQDLRVRHELRMRVTTSARLHGRARGGMADTLWHQVHDPAQPCDMALEPVSAHILRAQRRARARGLFRPGMSAFSLGQALELDGPAAAGGPCHYFGQVWQRLEKLVPALARRPLCADALPAEIEAAQAWLAASRLSAGPCGAVA